MISQDCVNTAAGFVQPLYASAQFGAAALGLPGQTGHFSQSWSPPEPVQRDPPQAAPERTAIPRLEQLSSCLEAAF